MERNELTPLQPPEWRRERLRYRVLQWVYDRTGADCELTVTGGEIVRALGVAHEELFRLIHFLEYRGYLVYQGAGPRVCITEKGIEYLEVRARRRRSIRS